MHDGCFGKKENSGKCKSIHNEYRILSLRDGKCISIFKSKFEVFCIFELSRGAIILNSFSHMIPVHCPHDLNSVTGAL